MHTILIGPFADVRAIDFKDSYVIAVDKGLQLLIQEGLRFDYALGDFDGILSVPKAVNIAVFNQDKDESDFELALKYCRTNQITNIDAYGFLASNRMDHLFNNILLIHKYAELNVALKSLEHKIQIVKRGKHVFHQDYKYISFFAMIPSIITLGKGFKYQTNQLKLDYKATLAISNEVTNEAFLTVKKGRVIVIQSNGQ